MVALRGHCGDLGGLGVTMRVKHGSGESSLSAVRPCGMGVTPSMALDISGSPHLTIPHLLRGEVKELRDELSPVVGLVT